MATEPSAAMRAYGALKAQLLSGALAAGAHLDVDRLAGALGLSVTPVRQALAQLLSERLITTHAQKGYQAALWPERELAALYEWRGLLVGWAIGAWPASDAAPVKPIAPAPYPAYTRAVLSAFDRGRNDNLTRAAANADDRLAPARLVEEAVLANAFDDARLLASAFERRDLGKCRMLARRYHSRRVRAASGIRAAVVLGAL